MKNKKLIPILLILTMILLVGTVSAVPDGGVSYYNFDNLTDQWGSNDATNGGATSSASYPTYNISGSSSPSSFSFDGTAGYLSTPNNIGGNTEISISVWVYFDSVTGIRPITQNWADVTNQHIIRIVDGELQWLIVTNINTYSLATDNLISGQWYHIVATYDGSIMHTYVDSIESTNNLSASGTINTGSRNSGQENIGKYGTSYFDGLMDEIKIFSKALNTTEISNLYNYGNIEGTYTSENFTITVTDGWSGADVNNISVIVLEDNICYQEQANESSLTDGNCGLDYSGNYSFFNNANDGDWTTYTSSSSATYYINYSVPDSAANSSLWRVSTDDASCYDIGAFIPEDFQTNLSLSSCSFDDVLELKVNLGSSQINYYCLDDTDTWSLLLSYEHVSVICAGGIAVQANYFYEEGIYWNITSKTYTNTTGNTIHTNIPSNSTELYDITVQGNNYLDKTYNSYNVSEDLSAELHQSEISFITKELITDSIINDTNCTINDTTQLCSEQFNLSAGTYDVTISADNYFDLTTSTTISALENTTKTLSGLYNSLVNLTAIYDYNESSLTSFNGTIANDEYGYFTLYETTTGVYQVGLIQNLLYNISITEPTPASNTQYYDFTPTSLNEAYEYVFYTPNSINFNFYNLSDLSLITSTVNFKAISDSVTYTGSSTNGTYFLDEMQPDNYKITVTSTGFSDSILYADLSGTHRNMSFYLDSEENVQTTSFYVIDNYGDIVADATITIYYNINGTTVAIWQRITDFTGGASFNLDPDKDYDLVVTKSGYDTFTGDITPTDTTYTIKIDEAGSEIFTSVFEDVGFSTNFVQNTVSSATAYLTAVSGSGSIEYYGLTSTYNNVTYSSNITSSPSGGTTSFVMSVNATIEEMVSIDYFIKPVGQDLITWTENKFLSQASINSNTSLTGDGFSTDGLGEAGKALVGGIIILVFLLIGFGISRNMSVAIVMGFIGTGIVWVKEFVPWNYCVITIIVGGIMLVINMMGER